MYCIVSTPLNGRYDKDFSWTRLLTIKVLFFLFFSLFLHMAFIKQKSKKNYKGGILKATHIYTILKQNQTFYCAKTINCDKIK